MVLWAQMRETQVQKFLLYFIYFIIIIIIIIFFGSNSDWHDEMQYEMLNECMNEEGKFWGVTIFTLLKEHTF